MIHPSALIDPRARLGDNVTVGPYVIVDGPAEIGAGTTLDAYTLVRGHVSIGARCRIGPMAAIGTDPQSTAFKGGETWAVVGDECVIREGAVVHRATQAGRDNATRVGDRCFLMTNAHVAHDCVIGDDVTLASAVLLGGHVRVADRAFLGGGCGVHQFCRVGRLAIIGGTEVVRQDVPPFAAVKFGGLKAYNVVGCRRAGLSATARAGIKRAYQTLRRTGNTAEAIQAVRAAGDVSPEVEELLGFLATSRRGVVRNASTFKRRLLANLADDGGED